MALKTITVDGLLVETTDAGEAAITKLKGMLADAAGAMEAASAKHTTAIAEVMKAHQEAMAAKETALGTKDAELVDARNKIVPDAKLDALVADRSAVIARAKAIAPAVVTDGKSNVELRRAAVAMKLGDAKVKDTSDDYVQGLFDHLGADVKTPDTLRDAIRDGAPAFVGDAKAVTDALAARAARFNTGYLNQPATAA